MNTERNARGSQREALVKKKKNHQSQLCHQAASIIYARKVQRGRLAYQFPLRAFDVSASFVAE